MAYEKHPKVIQDFALGFQDVNRASDNELAIRDAYDTEHLITANAVTFGFGAQYDNGHHDHVTIARAVGSVKIYTIQAFGSATPKVNCYFEVASIFGIVKLARIDVGLYFLSCSGFSLLDTWAEGHAVVTGSAQIRRVTPRRKSQYATGSTQPANGVMFYLYERNAGSGEFELADFDFTFAVFST